MGLHCVHVDLERWRYGGKPACGCIDGSLGRNLRFMIGANKTQRELHFCVAHGCLGENNSGVGSVGMRTRPGAEEWGLRQSGCRAGWGTDNTRKKVGGTGRGALRIPFSRLRGRGAALEGTPPQEEHCWVGAGAGSDSPAPRWARRARRVPPGRWFRGGGISVEKKSEQSWRYFGGRWASRQTSRAGRCRKFLGIALE